MILYELLLCVGLSKEAAAHAVKYDRTPLLRLGRVENGNRPALALRITGGQRYETRTS